MNALTETARAADPAALGASVSVRNLTVTYNNGFTAVQDASFDLDPGTICALVGVNGSGKSTIFKAIMGFVRPSAGEVLLCGRPVAEALRAAADAKAASETSSEASRAAEPSLAG